MKLYYAGLNKRRYREGMSLPSWLRELPEQDRTTVIEQLTVRDFFRSQFRAEPGAVRSPIEIVDWGLRHIDRLRSAILDKRESRLRLWTSKWIPLCSTAVAVIALLTSTYLQRQASADQRILKEYELAFRPKVDGYTRLMQALTSSFQRSTNPGDPGLNSAFNDIELTEIQLEPFLKTAVRKSVKDEVQEFIRFCLDVRRPDPSAPTASDKQIQEFLDRRNHLRNTLHEALFQ